MPLRVAIIGAGNVVRTKHCEAYAALRERIVPYALFDPSEDASPVDGGAAGYSGGAPLCLAGGAGGACATRWTWRWSPHRKSTTPTASTSRRRWGGRSSARSRWRCHWTITDAMLAVARRHGVRLGVVHNFYYMRTTGDCRALILAGEIGEVKTGALRSV